MAKHNYYNTRQDQSLAVVPRRSSTSLAANAATVYEVAQLQALENNLRAALAKQTMDNTALLAMHEFQCKCEAPEGAEEYREIVKSYARSSIELWGGGY